MIPVYSGTMAHLLLAGAVMALALLLFLSKALHILLRCFIDDIFGVWTHRVDLLQTFFEDMNRTHPTIQFEMSYSVSEISFLNVLILNRDNELHRTLYKKTTDLPSLPHSHSF